MAASSNVTALARIPLRSLSNGADTQPVTTPTISAADEPHEVQTGGASTLAQAEEPQRQHPERRHQGLRPRTAERRAHNPPKKTFARHCPASWINSAFTLAAIIIAVYYGWWSLKFMRWSALNDFRESCGRAEVC